MKTREKIEIALVIIICLSVFIYSFYKGYLCGREGALNNLQQLENNTKVIRVVGGHY